MSHKTKHLLVNEIQAYTQWIVACDALDHCTELLNDARLCPMCGKAAITRASRLQQVAILEEEDCFDRWRLACEQLDEENTWGSV